MKIIFIFSCSGMFRNVPECSMFRVLSTPPKKREKKFELLEDDSKPQLFKFYIYPERKYNINKDNTEQN